MVHLHNGILLVVKKKKKKETLPFATASIDLAIIMLSEISQSEKEKYHMISLIMWNLMKKQTNKQNRKHIDTKNRLTAVKSG